MKFPIKNKRIQTFLLDLISLSLILSFLVYFREKSKYFIEQIQIHGAPIQQLSQQQNLTQEQLFLLTQTTEKVQSLINQSLLLSKLIFPLTIIIIFIVFQIFVWKILTKVKAKTFIIYIILPTIIMLYIISTFLDFLVSLMAGEAINYILFIIAIIASLLLSYLALIALSNPKNTLKQNLNKIKKIWKKTLLPFIVLIPTTILFLVIFASIFIAAIAKVSLAVPIVLGIFALILINFERTWFIKKAK